MNKENEKELRKHLELQTKEELIEQIIIQTRTYENALNIITDKNEIIDKVIELIKFEWQKIIENKNYSNHLWTVDGLVIKQLLDILRGEDNE